MTPENRFHYCKLNNRSKTMLIILLLVWDFNPMSSLHFLFLCVKDPAARSEGILCSVFTTWRTSHALSHWQGQDWQALHPRWQEVWHPVAGQHNYSGYFHTSLFIRIFSDYFLHFFMYFFIHGPLSFFTIFYKCHPTTSQSLAHFNLISNEKKKNHFAVCSVWYVNSLFSPQLVEHYSYKPDGLLGVLKETCPRPDGETGNNAHN